MNKKILSLIIALSLPLTFLVGCNKSKNDEFVMTENTTALDGSVEYSAKTYKDAFYSTENYSDEYLQNEFEAIVKEITSKKDKEELVDLLKSYSNTQDGDFSFVKSCFEKYDNQSGNSQDVTLDSNGMHEISSRLYKATLNATKKYYDINDFYIYYKDKLSASSRSKDNEDFENEVKITAIKEYTIANIYKNAYNDSFISEVITSIETSSNSDETVNAPTENVTKPETNTPVVDNNNNNNNTTTDDDSDDTYPEYLELTEAVKSQIYDAGVNAAIEFIGQNIQTSSSAYCREVYDALENDNPLGENKEEGYKSFLEGFKTTLENNSVDFE
ncbi:hypothetical protein [Terrisporobacter mayombei]|uniref:hypothetical protein n=1 Tax=Terrisporobacter mayombei TaxID=1541 RepID=UPI00265A94CD|nr:hypothetical protein [Terrisporobacter mayombei]MCC3668696.1 hypothetical protein [Terrisporobacter mayombei]